MDRTNNAMVDAYEEERAFIQKRRFELFEDKILVRVLSGSQSPSESRIDLDTLRPEPNKMFIKDKIISLIAIFLIINR